MPASVKVFLMIERLITGWMWDREDAPVVLGPKGTGHFDVPEHTALHLHEQLRRRLPGYLVPKLVREIAGEPYKSWLS